MARTPESCRSLRSQSTNTHERHPLPGAALTRPGEHITSGAPAALKPQGPP
jgi:hypothetical protein